MFNFRLHFTQWVSNNDGEQIYRALELADGSYLVTCKTPNGVIEVPFTQEEVSQEMALGHWIITNGNGEITT